MIIEKQPEKHQQIIQNSVLPKIQEIFPNEAKCELYPNEKESVKVIFRIPLPDDPTKPPEKKYKRISILFSIDLIDDWLDPENKNGETHFQTVLKRIYDRIQSKYLTIQIEKIHNDKKVHEIIISSKTLNLVN